MSNVLPIIRDPRAAKVRRAIDDWRTSDNYWRDKLLVLAIELKTARDEHESDTAFGRWLADNGCDDLGEWDRAALIKMGRHVDLSKAVLATTNRRSPQHIWKEEIKPRVVHVNKPTTDVKNHNVPGRPVKVTAGQTLSETGRDVVRLLQSGASNEDVVKQLSISMATLNCLRDIILLSERNDLSEADSKMVSDAVKLMDAQQQLREPMNMIKPIADRLWGERGQRLRAAKARYDQFVNSIRIVHSTCENAADIDIPYLNAAQAKDFHEQLASAKEAVDRLDQRIREEVR